MRVLALHGFLGDRSDWSDFTHDARKVLPDLDLDAVDLPGHGNTPTPVPGDFAGWVDWVRARLDHGAGPTHLIGYSLGGRLALAAALAEVGTGRVSSLTLLAASPGLSDSTERATRLSADRVRAEALTQDGLENFLRSWYQMPLFGPAVELVGLDLLVARRARGQAASLAAALRTAGAAVMPDLRPDLPRLDIPVLTIAGERDPKYIVLERDIAETVPRGRFAALAGVGHSLLIEAPERCADLWCAFVTDSANLEGASP